jgi:hypothetical protein
MNFIDKSREADVAVVYYARPRPPAPTFQPDCVMMNMSALDPGRAFGSLQSVERSIVGSTYSLA